MQSGASLREGSLEFLNQWKEQETFLKETSGSVANLITEELQDLDAVKVQMTTWVRFKVEVEDGDGNIVRVDMVKKAFNSQIMEVFQGSDLGEIIKEVFTHMKTQVENLALANSGFVFNQVLDINFHKLNLTRGSSYLPLPDWIPSKKAVINLKNEEDEECFNWAILTALHHKDVDSHPERISKLRRFEGGYDWGRLTFPVALNKVGIFEWKIDVSVNVLAMGGGKEKLYILKNPKFYDRSRMANLLLVAQEGKKHYAVI